MSIEFLRYWYFNVPNYLLAALTYTMLGRVLLGFFVPENWDNYIWRAFLRITNPVVAFTRFVTPLVVAPIWLLFLGALWVHVARVLFTLIMLKLGLTPEIAAQ